MRLGVEAGTGTISIAQALGVGAAPVSARALADDPAKALSAHRDAGLAVCQISAFEFNPLHDDPERRRETAAIVEGAIAHAGATGCRHIVICGGNHHPTGFGGYDPRNRAPDALKRVAERLEPLLALAARAGVLLSVEPYIKTVVDGPESFHRLRALVAHPDALVANVDVTSLYDLKDYMTPAERCRAVCEGFAGAYGLGHIKDIGLKDGFHIEMRLAPLGTSPTDWTEVLRMMARNMPADSWLVLEHLADLETAKASLAMLRRSAAEAGVELS